MLDHPFFKKRHPKSTGKEVFNIKFIPKELLKKSPNDILATLTELTAICVAKSLNTLKKLPEQVIICGGGIKNRFLVNSIEKLLKIDVVSSNEYGFDPQAIEAMAFGWMASQRIYKNPLYVKDKKGLLGSITRSKQ
jgi:anhydro-N-acetylmuramic acid kinase